MVMCDSCRPFVALLFSPACRTVHRDRFVHMVLSADVASGQRGVRVYLRVRCGGEISCVLVVTALAASRRSIAVDHKV